MNKKEILYVIGLLFGIIFLGNVIFLDYVFFVGNFTKNATSDTSQGFSITQFQSNTSLDDPTCPKSCVAQIYQATTSSKQVFVQPTSAPAVTSTSVSSSVREFFVAFGSGSNSSDDWEDVGGVAAYVDTNNYASIKQVIFETTIHTPTGNQTAFVRLYNVTDKHPVWGSEVSLDGSGPKLLSSGSITLDAGKKLYQVQMKTQLKFQAVLDQARLHITTY